MIASYKNIFWGLIAAAAVSIMTMTPSYAFFGSAGNQVPVTINKAGNNMGYYEYLPVGYEEKSGKKFPIVINLHGIGEIGNGNSQLGLLNRKGVGLTYLLAQGKDIPAIILSPQSLVDPWQPAAIDAFITYAMKTYKADPDRLYVIGLSLGGGGTWNYGLQHADKIAAMLPICGGSWFYQQNVNTSVWNNMPIWAFHAIDDKILSSGVSVNNWNKFHAASGNVMATYTAGKDVTFLYSQATKKYTTLTGAGTTTTVTPDTRQRFTMFASGGHFIWDRVYNDANMWNWLFSWKRGGVYSRDGIVVSPPVTSPVVTPPITTPVPTAPAAVSHHVNIDFGNGGVSNTWTDGGGKTGTVIKLINEIGATPGATMAVLNSADRVDNGGLASPPVALGLPAFATKDLLWGLDKDWSGFKAQPVTSFELRGFYPGKKYALTFFSSRMGVTNGDVLNTQFAVTANGVKKTAVLNAANNISKKATIVDVIPGADGKIRIDVSKGAGNISAAGFYMINSLVISY